MLYAIINNQKSLPTPKTIGHCPACNSDVRSKCGEIKVWHWAHISKDCDPWYEPESEWHRGWKEWLPDHMTEVTMGPHRADIVAADGTVVELQHSSISVEDIRARESFYGRMIWLFDARKWTLSVQTKRVRKPCVPCEEELILRYESDRDSDSYLSRLKVDHQLYRVECAHTDRWLDGVVIYNSQGLNPGIFSTVEFETESNEATFQWKHARKTLRFCRKDIYLDLGDRILGITYLDWKRPVSGQGIILSHNDFAQFIWTK